MHGCRLVQDLISLAQAKLPTFKISQVHMSTWGLAKLCYPLEDIPLDWLDAMAARALTRFQEPPAVEVVHLSNLLWAFARLGYNPLDGALLQVAFQQAKSRQTPPPAGHPEQLMSRLLSCAGAPTGATHGSLRGVMSGTTHCIVSRSLCYAPARFIQTIHSFQCGFKMPSQSACFKTHPKY